MVFGMPKEEKSKSGKVGQNRMNMPCFVYDTFEKRPKPAGCGRKKGRLIVPINRKTKDGI